MGKIRKSDFTWKDGRVNSMIVKFTREDGKILHCEIRKSPVKRKCLKVIQKVEIPWDELKNWAHGESEKNDKRIQCIVIKRRINFDMEKLKNNIRWELKSKQESIIFFTFSVCSILYSSHGILPFDVFQTLSFNRTFF